MLPISLQLLSGSLHLAQRVEEPVKSCGTVLGAEVPAPQKRSGDRSLSLLNYLLFTLVLASSISLFGLPNH